LLAPYGEAPHSQHYAVSGLKPGHSIATPTPTAARNAAWCERCLRSAVSSDGATANVPLHTWTQFEGRPGTLGGSRERPRRSFSRTSPRVAALYSITVLSTMGTAAATMAPKRTTRTQTSRRGFDPSLPPSICVSHCGMEYSRWSANRTERNVGLEGQRLSCKPTLG
jgi:hypothetical protein